MKYTRIYSDPAGESHFEDVEVELKLVDFSPPAPAPPHSSRALFRPSKHNEWNVLVDAIESGRLSKV